ncbi:MAG: MBL fold metallo-hydrolase [Dehalococcoidia bacterium]|nr:MBL fold metallo-hydrolase [Dehalococcoidia bacterium]
MEICPGVHQVPGLRWSNAYLLVEPARLTLIDSGLPGDGKKVLAYIQQLGRSPSELERVIVTHGHPDHTGPLKGLSRHTGAVIAVHPSDTRYREKTNSRWLHYPAQPPALDWSRWDLPFLHRIPAHELIEDGQLLPVLGGLQVLHTPGHTPGSVCLYLAGQKVLFTGDTLLADGQCFRRRWPSQVPTSATTGRPWTGWPNCRSRRPASATANRCGRRARPCWPRC